MTEIPSRRPVALVTGSSGGLGRAFVTRLGEDGLRVVAADRDPADAPDPELMAARLDVTDEDAVQALVAEVGDRWGPITVLVNNAGIAGPSAAVADYPPDAWRSVIDVNLTGAFLCLRACLPGMLAGGYGRVVNVASIAGKEGNPWMSAYSASKAGLIALTKSAAKEVAADGVLINCVVPAVLDTGLTEQALTSERERFVSHVPMGRMGRATELAELVSWLASSRCSFSTGAAFDLSGGRAVY